VKFAQLLRPGPARATRRRSSRDRNDDEVAAGLEFLIQTFKQPIAPSLRRKPMQSSTEHATIGAIAPRHVGAACGTHQRSRGAFTPEYCL
jgi:hypothetical protein